MKKLIILCLICVLGCTQNKNETIEEFDERNPPDEPPSVEITGTLEGARGVVAFSLNDIPYRGIFKKEGSKYLLNLPLYLNSLILPIPDSLSIKIVLRCRNQVTPKMKIQIKSNFLAKSPSEKEIEFSQCIDGTTNKFLYLRIKDKVLPKVQMDSVKTIALL